MTRSAALQAADYPNKLWLRLEQRAPLNLHQQRQRRSCSVADRSSTTGRKTLQGSGGGTCWPAWLLERLWSACVSFNIQYFVSYVESGAPGLKTHSKLYKYDLSLLMYDNNCGCIRIIITVEKAEFIYFSLRFFFVFFFLHSLVTTRRRNNNNLSIVLEFVSQTSNYTFCYEVQQQSMVMIMIIHTCSNFA